jgi:hypothetical protein
MKDQFIGTIVHLFDYATGVLVLKQPETKEREGRTGRDYIAVLGKTCTAIFVTTESEQDPGVMKEYVTHMIAELSPAEG